MAVATAMDRLPLTPGPEPTPLAGPVPPPAI
jgi:hypothetical protein